MDISKLCHIQIGHFLWKEIARAQKNFVHSHLTTPFIWDALLK